MRKTGALIGVLVLVMFTVPSMAEEIGWDGYEWETMSEESKLYYIIGYGDGMSRVLAPIDYLLSVDEERFGECEKRGVGFVYDLYIEDFPWGVLYDDTVEGVNHFYDDFRNMRIAIPDAIRVVSMQLYGESEESINSEIEDLRKDLEEEEKLERDGGEE